MHPPVILVPALVVVTLAFLARADWRRRYGIAWALLALAALGTTVLAAGAGDKLLESARAGHLGAKSVWQERGFGGGRDGGAEPFRTLPGG